MKQTFFLSLGISCLLFTGCQHSEHENAIQTATISKPLQQKLQYSASFSSTQKHQQTSQALGILVENGKIVIDTKQTRNFLQNIEEKMHQSFSRIEKNLRKEQIQSPNETGIIITDTSIQIDLNKTKHFMEKWVRSMESVVSEIDGTLREIEQSLP